MEKEPLLILTGPTAVGKTELSLRLAQAVNGEIVSADSMQVYCHMDIGSAKIMPGERRGIPHYLIDVLNPWEEFNIVSFQRLAREACDRIRERGHIPIVTGGTGFYIQALLYDIDFTENDEDKSVRAALEETAAREGGGVLYERLCQVDPASARTIHANNTKRIIRALEYYEKTGTPISSHNEEQRKKESPYRFLYAVLTRDREELYGRIDRRVDGMMEAGLVEEVKTLKAMGCTRQMVAMQGLGYKEILDYLDGILTLEEAVYRIKRDTRHFAKRQMTWFRREREVDFISMDGCTQEEALTKLLTLIRERGILPADSLSGLRDTLTGRKDNI
ncbi:MAG: tRNA (adenosine(37)-N6)-dimethylallyltransferase MiaA [Lachnospiraceae bacterium]|jgi:tRNA dimethylallyltransferase|nr:tRNA (adenosine(37)-N6)-dimethylallyltransferase MiaA [Lachnospiraceae bacterium]